MDYSQPPIDSSSAPRYQYLRSGLMTRSSSGYDSRRDSFASSSASYAHGYANGSVPSSATSSFCSPGLPATPTSAGGAAPEDYLMIPSQSSVRHPSPHAYLDSNARDFFQETPIPHRSKPGKEEGHFQPSITWNQGSHGGANNLSLSIPEFGHVASASAGAQEFGPPLHVNQTPYQQNMLSAVDIHTTAGSWEQLPSPVTPSVAQGMAGSYCQERLSNSWSSNMPSSQYDQGPSQLPHHAIMPTETLIDDQSYVQVPNDSYEDGYGYYPGYSSDCDISPSASPTRVGNDRTPLPKEEFDYYVVDQPVRRRICRTSTGGKTIKKERRETKKKTRSLKTNRGCTFNRFGIEVVQDDLYSKVGPEGRWVGSSQPGQRQYCDAILADGRRCMRPFKRPEHLKRHVRTHTGAKDFRCCVPGCKTPPFSRNDNCMAHYKTHVQKHKTDMFFPENYGILTQEPKKGARNHPVPWEEFVERVRSGKRDQPEEAAKIIEAVRRACQKDDETKLEKAREDKTELDPLQATTDDGGAFRARL